MVFSESTDTTNDGNHRRDDFCWLRWFLLQSTQTKAFREILIFTVITYALDVVLNF